MPRTPCLIALLPLLVAARGLAATQAVDPVVFRGTVVLDEGGGRSRTPQTGSFELWLNHPPGPRAHEVRVSDGRFEAELPGGLQFLALGRARLDGLEAWCEADLPLAGPQRALEIRAHPLPRSFLRVFASDSGRELSRYELVESDAGLHPGEMRFFVARVEAAPFEIPTWSEDPLLVGWRPRRNLWARASGYAWGRAVVDLGAGREWRLELVPAGDLLIELAQGVSPEGKLLTVADPRDRWTRFQVFPRGEEPTVVESLAPGRYQVRLEEFGGRGALVASAEVEVRAGEVATAVLESVPPPTAEDTAGDVPCAGSLRVPLSWGVEEVHLLLQRWEPDGRYHTVTELTPRRSADDPALWAWDAGLQPPGAYLAFVRPFLLSHTFPLWPAATDPVPIAVPAPAEVHVRLVDAGTGAPARGARLGWYGMPPPQPSGVTTQSVQLDPERDRFVFRAPIGEIVLVVTGGPWGMVFEPEWIAAGVNEIELELGALCTIEVVLMDGALVVSPTDATAIEALPMDGVGEVAVRGWGSYLSLQVDRPGRWEVRATGLPDGYAPGDPVVVEARRGETVRCELPLVRLR